MQDDIKITLYEPWMKSQIALLFEKEYGVEQSEFESLMTQLYEHPIQSEKCIKIVALDQEKVVGFQSFFYWPYVLNNRVFNSYQSGNSLTHPDYRGKGIFKKLLNFVFENSNLIEADFFVGFPVQASYGSFMKNRWQNLFDLVWYLKVINPVAFLFSRYSLSKHFSGTFIPYLSIQLNNLRLNESHDFYLWKNDLKSQKQNYFFHSYKISAEEEITFEMKFQTRKRVINELVIGKIYFKGNSHNKLEQAFNDLLKKITRVKCVTICSIAINESLQIPNYKSVLTVLNFKRIDKKIYFIVRKASYDIEALKPQYWDIGRADIDTW